jgi:hypothetical protein
MSNNKTKRYYILNKDKFRINKINQRDKNIESWKIIIPEETKCQVCNEVIYFNRKDFKQSINFDHKTGREKIKGSPMAWLRENKYNETNKKIWESCKFGMLCYRCNQLIPTGDRFEWLDKLETYVKS